jgi:hypothetical protein
MKFLYPEFLWALTLISIPIIIHLFNFRKFQKIYFSNIGLLKEVELETKSKSQLKHLILLALRILAISSLVVAFAQPYFPSDDFTPPGDHHISIYIDNSHSMDSKGENGYRLDLAKEQAVELVNGFAPTDQFQVITNDFEGRHQRFFNKSDCINLINEIKPSFTSKKLSEVFSRQTELFRDANTNKTVFWLSDFQTNSADFSAIKTDSSIKIVCLPYYHQTTQNMSIDSLYFETPVRRVGAEDNVFAYVSNQSEQELSFKLVLYVNEEATAFVNFDIGANSQKKCEVPFTLKAGGVQHCRLEIMDYPDADLTFDDTFFFTYFVKPTINVLHVYETLGGSGSDKYVSSLFGKNEFFTLKSTPLSNVDFSSISQYDLVITSEIQNFSSGLSTSLEAYINQGGNVLIFPGKASSISSYNAFISLFSNALYQNNSSSQTKVAKLDSEHPIYQGIFDELPSNVDLPTVFNYFPISNPSSSSFSNLMLLQSGSPFMSYLKLPLGSITLCASPLNQESSSFPKHALFVPTLLRIAEFSQSQQKYAHTIGKDVSIDVDNILKNAENLVIRMTDSTVEFKPEVKKTNNGSSLLLYDQIKKSGGYNTLSSGSVIGGFSFNYDRIESEQKFLTAESLAETINTNNLASFVSVLETDSPQSSVSLSDALNAKKYWKYLLILALILLAAEIAVYRLFR